MSALDDWLAARELARAAIEERPDATVAPNVSYQRLHAVDRLHAPSLHPGHFYFDGDALRLVYIADDALGGHSASQLAAELGEPDEELPSRAGKLSRIELYARRGLAFSHEGDELEFVQVFPPTTPAGYHDAIYEDPGEFIR